MFLRQNCSQTEKRNKYYLERAALLGKNGCFWGKARTRYYGVTPDQKIPDDFDAENTGK